MGLVISRQLIELHGGKMGCKSEKNKGSVFYFTVKFGIPPSLTQPQPHTPKNEVNQDPFFRTHGYSSTAMLKQQQEEKDSPVKFMNRSSSEKDKHQLESSAIAHSKKHCQLVDTTAISNPAEILQDVLMSRTVSMQLKPPPVRKNSAAHNKPTHPMTVKSENISTKLRIPTIGSTPGGSNLSNQSYISPPRASSCVSPLRVLIVSQWKMSQESLVKHVNSILSNLVTQANGNGHYFQIETVISQIEATKKLLDPEAPVHDYIMINLSSEQQVLSLTKFICSSARQQQANVLVVTTPMQRSAITEITKGKENEVIPKSCGFVFKPIKRTKLQWYFGVKQGQYELRQSNSNTTQSGAMTSNISAPDTPYKRAATQKEVFERMAADVCGKGYKVLLVEGIIIV